MDIVKKTLVEVYSEVLNSMAEEWKKHVGADTRVYNSLNVVAQELTKLREDTNAFD